MILFDSIKIRRACVFPSKFISETIDVVVVLTGISRIDVVVIVIVIVIFIVVVIVVVTGIIIRFIPVQLRTSFTETAETVTFVAFFHKKSPWHV